MLAAIRINHKNPAWQERVLEQKPAIRACYPSNQHLTESANCYKVHLRSADVWTYSKELPAKSECDEWLYLDENCVPSIYWNEELSGLLLI